MASFINSIRNITSDSWWFVKIAFFSAVVFFVLDQGYYQRNNQSYMIVYLLLCMLGFGCASFLMNRNINNRTPILPSFFNIPVLIKDSIFSSIVAIPGTVLFCIVVNYLYENFEFEPFVAFIVYLCVTLFFVSFIFIPMVLYSVNGNLTDAFKFNIIYEASGNYTVQFASYLIQYVFIMGFATYLVYITILEMLGDHVGLLILKAVVIVISFLSVFSFSSDLYQDVIPEIKKRQDKKRRRIRQ
ncbi:MAG: hypothetical protein IJY61_06305 [Candidatus Gastranaerophilales bacterium]|nr:hypothetical protein [Candidatus Gastranaerophilales bacterium]